MNGSFPGTGGPLILLVEDNERNARLVWEILLANGYRLALVEDGVQAIEVAHQLHPDLILMDLQLPVLDGMSATRKLKSDPRTNEIPIIAVTANAMSERRKQMLATGCIAYITKPISYRPFLEEIARVLDGPRLAG